MNFKVDCQITMKRVSLLLVLGKNLFSSSGYTRFTKYPIIALIATTKNDFAIVLAIIH